MTGLVAQAALAFALGHGEIRFAVYYNPGRMEGVAVYRGLSVTPCMFAHPTLPIGTRARIRGVRTGHEELCDQRDTSQDIDTTGRGSGESDRQRHIRLSRVELSHAASRRICPPGWQGAARECGVVFRVIE